ALTGKHRMRFTSIQRRFPWWLKPWRGSTYRMGMSCSKEGGQLCDRNLFSPEWAYNLNLDYRYPFSGNLEARGVLNVNYSDEIFASGDSDPIYAHQPSYTTVDLRFGIGHTDGSWEVAFLGKNLTDEYVSGSINDVPLMPGKGFAFTDRLRSYAIQGTYRF
ncbi:TonB-dependent receptor, partial [Pseudomaricurvus alkylphenolicus]